MGYAEGVFQKFRTIYALANTYPSMLPYQGDLPELSDAEDIPPAESGSDSEESPLIVPDEDSWI